MLKTSFFIDIWFVKQDIKKWLKTMICSFLWLIWKWKEKGTKKIDLPDGDLNPGFLNKFPPKIWILREISSIELKVLKKSWLYLGRQKTSSVIYSSLNADMYSNFQYLSFKLIWQSLNPKFSTTYVINILHPAFKQAIVHTHKNWLEIKK